jgi:sulfur carrier protein
MTSPNLPTIRVNGEPAPLTAATVAGLLVELGVDPVACGAVAVALNADVVPRSAWASTPLAGGDEVEVVRPFQGG